MDQEAENTECGSDPHECKHILSNRSANIQFCLRGCNVSEDDGHDSSDNRCGRGEQSCNECPDRQGQRPPAAVEGNGSDEDIDKVHAYSRQKEAEHEVGSNPDQF